MTDSMPFYLPLARAWKGQTLNRFHQTLQQSRLMLAVIGGFVVGYWILFTWLFYEGIYFVQFGVPGLGELLLGRMFYVLFALIFIMLVTSSAIVGYGVFFRNLETAWLQTLPVSHGQLFRWKFLEMSILASWAFVFLSGPLLLAYAIALKLSPLFLAGVLILYLPFSLLANVLGTAILLVVVWLWHDAWGRRLLVALLGVGLGVGVLWFKPIDVQSLKETEIVPLMNALLKNTRMVTSPFLPSYWLASGVMGLSEKLWGKTLLYFGVISSYALWIGWLLLRFSGPLFHEDCSRVQDRRLHGRAFRMRNDTSPLCTLGKLLMKGLPWLKPPVRSILLKDWITFWRDTAQWSQFAIFFGLLGFYFLNIRTLRYRLDERFWVSVVSFLNLSSLGLILSTLTTRFVFPQFSLEGRRLWLIGLAPLTLREVVWGKFWFSALASGGITLSLMFFSFNSLQLEPEMRQIIAFTVVMMSMGLSGIAVGMGILFPNMKQSNAAQIVSGFGGTFCLVLSLAYVAATVILVALPMHLRYMARLPLQFQFTSVVGMIYTGILALGLAAVFLPMRLGEKKLERLEI